MVDRRAPKILSPDDALKLLKLADEGTARNLAAVTISLFAGVRPQELDRVGWGSVQEDRGIITVDAEASKARHRRIVNLMPAAVTWIRYARKRASKLPWCRTARQRFIQQFKREMGIEWQPDILRHTCASYWLSAVPDAGRVALELGNSPTILLRHYRELVSKEDSDRFWGIMP